LGAALQYTVATGATLVGGVVLDAQGVIDCGSEDAVLDVPLLIVGASSRLSPSAPYTTLSVSGDVALLGHLDQGGQFWTVRFSFLSQHHRAEQSIGTSQKPDEVSHHHDSH
jgi:hypothetical protein